MKTTALSDLGTTAESSQPIYKRLPRGAKPVTEDSINPEALFTYSQQGIGLQNLYAPVRLRSAPPAPYGHSADSIAGFSSRWFTRLHARFRSFLLVLARSFAQKVDKGWTGWVDKPSLRVWSPAGYLASCGCGCYR